MPAPVEPTIPKTSAASSEARAVALDLSRHSRLPLLADMLHVFSGATDPEQAWQAFFECVRKVHGKKGFLCIETLKGDGTDFRITHLVSVDGRNAIEPGVPFVPAQGPKMGDAGEQPETSTNRRDEDLCRGGFVSDAIAPPPASMGSSGKAPLANSALYVDLHIKNDPVLGNHLLMYRSAMLAPLHRDGRIGGWVWLLGLQPESFKEMHVEDFVLRCNALAATLDRIDRANRLRISEDRHAKQSARVAQIQRAFRPETLPEIRGLDIRASHESIGAAGGDFYLVYPLESAGRLATGPGGASSSESAGADLRTGFLLANVAGDGAAAAMIMAMIDGVIATLPHKTLAAADVLTILNRHLCSRRVEGARVGAFLGFYDPATRRLDYGIAAHPPVLVRRPPLRGDIQMAVLSGEGMRDQGSAMEGNPPTAHSPQGTAMSQQPGTGGRPPIAVCGGPPLGADHLATYAQSSFQLAADDTLLLMSHGVVGARNEQGEALGLERVSGLFQRSSGAAGDAIETLIRTLRHHEPTAGPGSDQTIIAVRINY